MNKQAYQISSRDYLRRAWRRLDDGSYENLFYAAFELRCAIEARMQEYISAQDYVSKKKKKDWKIAKLGKNIEETFKLGEKIVEFAVYDNGGNLATKLYYTPVTSRLRKMGEKLGDCVHAMKKYRKPTDNWWAKLQEHLEDTFTELEKANFGTLLGPPLLHPKTKAITMSVEVIDGETVTSAVHKIGKPGQIVVAKVRYLDDLPKTVLSQRATRRGALDR